MLQNKINNYQLLFASALAVYIYLISYTAFLQLYLQLIHRFD